MFKIPNLIIWPLPEEVVVQQRASTSLMVRVQMSNVSVREPTVSVLASERDDGAAEALSEGANEGLAADGLSVG